MDLAAGFETVPVCPLKELLSLPVRPLMDVGWPETASFPVIPENPSM
jgi:hypothetical protein